MLFRQPSVFQVMLLQRIKRGLKSGWNWWGVEMFHFKKQHNNGQGDGQCLQQLAFRAPRKSSNHLLVEGIAPGRHGG